MLDYTPHMTDDQLFKAARAMENYGGGFASAIANAFFRADSHNKKKLLAAFGDLFVEFSAYVEAAHEGETK